MSKDSGVPFEVLAQADEAMLLEISSERMDLVKELGRK
jgi:hypothetical protein